MSNYLVTGGAGFIGSHLVDYLVENRHDVTILDDFSNGSIKNLEHLKEINIVKGSVTSIPTEITNVNYDGIFHLATHPRSFSLQNPLKDIEVNAKGMINVLELAKKQEAKVVFTSNSGICGMPDSIPVNETHKDKPSTPYDANKLVSEYYCKIYHKIYGTRSIIFRLATVYGTRQKVNLELGWRPVIATLCHDVFHGRKPTIYGTGSQTRDLIHVSDIVQGLVKGMNSNVENADYFLLSTGIETSINLLLKMIFEISGKSFDIIRQPEIPGDIPRMCLSYDKAKNILNFEPKISLRNGIQEYFTWLSQSKKN